MPSSQVPMTMVISPYSRGSKVHLSFGLAVTKSSRLMTRELVDWIASDLLSRTVRRIKLQLENAPIPMQWTLAPISGSQRTSRPGP
jgi:hypothetical protein